MENGVQPESALSLRPRLQDRHQCEHREKPTSLPETPDKDQEAIQQARARGRAIAPRNCSPERRSEIAKAAAAARWNRDASYEEYDMSKNRRNRLRRRSSLPVKFRD